ncbi:hypothetical protein [Candidatus Pollutiaquabacter sp.]|uniref:hypothetical protein n=1 Tax=Candidatus Pollutiaquabacter sp. TaxID=3416354 RepID=UPI003CAAF529|nr:hypothetical protein [Bacteroidota bacterium]
MKSIDIKNASTSKTREKRINALYAQIFKEKQLPDTEDMRFYEKMEMVNVYELLESGEVERIDENKSSDAIVNKKSKSAFLILVLISSILLFIVLY